jgi:hypothetical protein
MIDAIMAGFIQKCALKKALGSAMLDREEADVDLFLSHLFSKEDVHLELGKLEINCQVMALKKGKVVGLSLLVILQVVRKNKVESAQDLLKCGYPRNI